MKCAMVYADGCRQIMLTPENDIEKEALKAMEMGGNETMRVIMKTGTFDDSEIRSGFAVNRCQGGYFRRFADSHSLMIQIVKDDDK